MKRPDLFLGMFILLVLLAALLVFCRLGANSLHDEDESYYALISRTMLQGGDWLTPAWGDRAFYNKPPLFFWLEAATFRVAGMSAWAIRFWPALTALLCVVFTVLLGKRLFGPIAGLWAGLCLCTSLQFLYEHCARTGEMDSLFILFLLTSLYYLLKAEEEPRFLYVSAVLMGLASLTKNFAGFIPLGIALAYLGLTRSWGRHRPRKLVLALALFLGLNLVWMVPMLFLHGKEFLRVFFRAQVLDRVVKSEYPVQAHGSFSYLGSARFMIATCFRGLFPWSCLLPAVLFHVIGRLKQWKQDARMVPVLWVVLYGVVLLFFKNKMHWYFIPLYPALAILAGAFLADAFRGDSIHRKAVSAAFLLVLGFSLFRFNTAYDPFTHRALSLGVDTVRLTPHFLYALTAAALIAAAWWALARWRFAYARSAMVAILVLYSIAQAAYPLQRANHKADAEELSEFLEENTRDRQHGRVVWWVEEDWKTPPAGVSPSVLMWYLSSVPGLSVQFCKGSASSVDQLLQNQPGDLVLIPAGFHPSLHTASRLVGAESLEGHELLLLTPTPY